MSFKVKKVAILGTGVMGAQIAAHISNADIEVLAFDMDQETAENGLKTAQGNVNVELLDELMHSEYITNPPPKSTGRKEFGSDLVKQLMREKPHIEPEDLLRTFCAFTAKSISVNLKSILNFSIMNPKMVISGGGVHHPVLFDDILKYLPISNIKSADNYGIEPKMKESLLMAVLAVARMQNLQANMPSVSGAERQTVLGNIFRAE